MVNSPANPPESFVTAPFAFTKTALCSPHSFSSRSSSANTAWLSFRLLWSTGDWRTGITDNTIIFRGFNARAAASSLS